MFGEIFHVELFLLVLLKLKISHTLGDLIDTAIHPIL